MLRPTAAQGHDHKKKYTMEEKEKEVGGMPQLCADASCQRHEKPRGMLGGMVVSEVV